MTESSQDYFHLAPGYQPLARRAGLDARAIFDHPAIHVWRTVPDRENAYIDLDDDQGKHSRWHIKRFPPHKTFPLPAQDQVEAHKLIVAEQIPTATLVGWGNLADRRSFVIFENLAGYTPADKLLEGGFPFDRLLAQTAKLSALLHTRGLHHRDLYLCHFMVRREGQDDANDLDIRLIDTARVRRLPSLFGRSRWVVKDLAQFLYSAGKLQVTEAQRDAWLDRYARERGMPSSANLRGPAARKSRQIARHDAKLMRLRPYRNVSIPS
jgi:UDP-glucose:(heptosyl)LPS alpha-1,3-glucosyltransferase